MIHALESVVDGGRPHGGRPVRKRDRFARAIRTSGHKHAASASSTSRLHTPEEELAAGQLHTVHPHPSYAFRFKGCTDEVRKHANHVIVRLRNLRERERAAADLDAMLAKLGGPGAIGSSRRAAVAGRRQRSATRA